MWDRVERFHSDSQRRLHKSLFLPLAVSASHQLAIESKVETVERPDLKPLIASQKVELRQGGWQLAYIHASHASRPFVAVLVELKDKLLNSKP